MSNVLTHKYLKAAGIPDNAVLPGLASTVVDMYYDFLPDPHDVLTLSFANGSAEVFVGDTITTNTGVTGVVVVVTLTGGSWGGGDQQGSLGLVQLSGFIDLSDTLESSSGGVIGLCIALSTRLRDTSFTDCSSDDVVVKGYANKSFITFDPALINPPNPIPWNETLPTNTYDAIVFYVSKSTSAVFNMKLGVGNSVVGLIIIDAETSNGGVKIMDSSGVIKVLAAPAEIPIDGVFHSYAVIIRRGATQTATFEVDGVDAGSVALNPVEYLQFTGENTLSFNDADCCCALVCRFKDGLPADYKEALAEMKASSIAGEHGISPRFVGIR